MHPFIQHILNTTICQALGWGLVMEDLQIEQSCLLYQCLEGTHSLYVMCMIHAISFNPHNIQAHFIDEKTAEPGVSSG